MTLAPTEAARYDLYRDRLPEQLHPGLRDDIYTLRVIFSEERPYTISTMVTYSPKWSYRRKPDSLNIYAFGSFRSHYAAIERVAKTLAEFFSYSDVLPLVRPVTNTEWRGQVEHEGPVFRDLRRNSILFYSEDRQMDNTWTW